jgi:hypothetical protein
MSNDVKIRVTSSAPDLKTTRDSVRSSYASMGQQAGSDFAKNLEKSVKDRATQVGDTAGKSFNTGLSRSSKGGAKDVGKDFADSLKSGVKSDVVAVGKELGTEFADAFNSGWKHAGKGFAERVYLNARAGLRPVGEELGREFADSFDGKTTSAGKKTGTQVGKNVANNLEQQTSAAMPLIALGIEAALGPAGGIAGAAIAGTFALALGAVGVIAAAKTKVVQDEFHQLTAATSNAWQQWGEDLKNPVANSIDYVRKLFINLAPDIEGDLKAAGPGIQIVASGLGLLATNTIPGLNAAAHQMGPVWMGIRSLLGDVGTSWETWLPSRLITRPLSAPTSSTSATWCRAWCRSSATWSASCLTTSPSMAGSWSALCAPSTAQSRAWARGRFPCWATPLALTFS